MIVKTGCGTDGALHSTSNINYLYCQIPEMMPVVKQTQDTTPASSAAGLSQSIKTETVVYPRWRGESVDAVTLAPLT